MKYKKRLYNKFMQKFYSNLLLEIDNLIRKKDFTQALVLIDKELKEAPYIPIEILNKLNNKKNNLLFKIKFSKKIKQKSITIFELKSQLLKVNNLELQFFLISQLNNVNLNLLINEIKSLMILNNYPFLLKLAILEKLKMQQIFLDFKVKKDKKIVLINSNINFNFAKNLDIIKISQILEKYLYAKNVYLYELSLNILKQYFYLDFPNFNEEQFKNIEIANAIIIYFNRIYNLNSKFNSIFAKANIKNVKFILKKLFNNKFLL